ncbi:FmdB family zinc ribbon protein [Chloroflexota bacterium]
MPIYEYVCPECGLKFELLRPLSQADEDAACPSCHKRAGRKLSAFACFSKDASGLTSPVAGTGNSCASCGITSCDTCGM